MPLDFIGQTIGRLWTILEANADWTSRLRPGNRIKLLGTGNPYPQKLARNAGDFGEAVITTAGGRWEEFSGQARVTFGNLNSADCPFILIGQVVYTLATTFDEARYDSADAVLAATIFSLSSAGARLGLPDWCAGRGQVQWRRVPDNHERPRVRDEYQIPVNYRIPKATLLA